MLQAGRISNVHLPKDRVTQTHQGYGFVEFFSDADALYASQIMTGIRLFGKPMRVNKASADKQRALDVGAELFVGNLDPTVDEKTLYDTFGRFGSLIQAPKITRDDANLSKGYGFVSFSNFESSDDAIKAMDGQWLMNREITVQYAYKKDGKGERHGDQAERMLAQEALKHGVQAPMQAIATSGGPASGEKSAAPLNTTSRLTYENGNSTLEPPRFPVSSFTSPAVDQHRPSSFQSTYMSGQQAQPQGLPFAAVSVNGLPPIPNGFQYSLRGGTQYPGTAYLGLGAQIGHVAPPPPPPEFGRGTGPVGHPSLPNRVALPLGHDLSHEQR